MTSLSEVYAGGVGAVASRRRQLLGTGLFVVGAAMVVGAIPIATTGLRVEVGLGVYEARELAGVLAGLGLPGVFVGIFTVLPAGRVTRAAAAIGASIAVLGVTMFSVAYPNGWLANDPTLAVATTVLYATGTLVTFWCLFVGVATFQTRNKPGGTARIEITDEGTVRVVTQDQDGIPGFGSVGMFGTGPDGDVETQTNQSSESGTPGTDDDIIVTDVSEESSVSGGRQASIRGTDPTPAGDGAGDVRMGEASNSEPDPAAASADVRDAVEQRGRPDEYCGNCSHFRYVRADGTMAPYCGLHDELMEDMNACKQWEPNS
jgi:hypothetical protein